MKKLIVVLMLLSIHSNVYASEFIKIGGIVLKKSSIERIEYRPVLGRMYVFTTKEYKPIEVRFEYTNQLTKEYNRVQKELLK